MLNEHKATLKLKNNITQFGKRKIQLSMHVNFISSKDTGETRIIYIWSDNKEILMGNETDDIIKERFRSFLENYQKEEQIMKEGSDFFFESIELFDYRLNKISFKRRKSYIKSPKWLKNKKATINPQNDDDKCFQYAALNYNKF